MSSIWFCHVALCMSSISFSLSLYVIFLSMTSLSHKCRRLRDLVPPLFSTSFTLPLLISLISKMKGFHHLILVFYAITPIIDIFQFHKILGRERERQRESMSIRV